MFMRCGKTDREKKCYYLDKNFKRFCTIINKNKSCRNMK